MCKEKELGKSNKSGYCRKCYYKSPQFLEYQRIYQQKLYHIPKNKTKRKVYNQQPKIKEKHKKYLKKYFKNPINEEKRRLAGKKYYNKKMEMKKNDR